MKPSEAAAVLAKCAAFDSRTIGDADAEGWAEVMTRAGIGLLDALDAVTDYHADVSTVDKRATVQALIIRGKVIRRQRMTAAGEPPFPPDFTVGQEMAWRRHWVAALTAGVEDPAAAADASMGVVRPKDPLVTNDLVMGQIRAIGTSKAIR